MSKSKSRVFSDDAWGIREPKKPKRRKAKKKRVTRKRKRVPKQKPKVPSVAELILQKRKTDEAWLGKYPLKELKAREPQFAQMTSVGAVKKVVQKKRKRARAKPKKVEEKPVITIPSSSQILGVHTHAPPILAPKKRQRISGLASKTPSGYERKGQMHIAHPEKMKEHKEYWEGRGFDVVFKENEAIGAIEVFGKRRIEKASGVGSYNKATGWMRVVFDAKPSREVLDSLKAHGFRYKPRSRAWSAK